MIATANLELWIGPAVPVKASRQVIEAVQSVTVINSANGPDAFQISFELSNQSPLHTLFLLAGGAALPLMRIVIAVRVNGKRDILIDGVVTHQQVKESKTPGKSILSVTGEDLTKVMDYIDFSFMQYPAMPDFARVTLILAKYAVLGIIPNVLPSPLIDVPIPIRRIPSHDGKDLGYIRKLADRVGYVFYIDTTDEVGVTRAYWGPKIRAGQDQDALSLDFRARRNVETLSFQYNSEQATLPIVLIQNQETKVIVPVPVPNLTAIFDPLALIPAIPKNVEPIPQTAKYNPVQAALIGLAVAAKKSEAAKATGKLDVRTYGRLLKARRPVGVRGAGVSFNGRWYVEQTTSVMQPGSFTQDFVLSRDGLVSAVDRVVA